MFVFLIVHVRHLNWDKCWAQTICTSDRSAGENKAWKNEPAENNGWVYKHHVLYTSSQRFVCVCVSLTVNQFVVVCVCVLSVYFIIVKSQHLSHTHTVCLSIVLSWSIIPVSGICSHPALTLFFLFHYRFVLSVCCVFVSNLQAVNHSPPVSSVVLLLPLRQPPDQLEDGALGERRVPVGRPANELEVLHQAVTVLWLKRDEGKIRILITTAVVITIKIMQYYFFLFRHDSLSLSKDDCWHVWPRSLSLSPPAKTLSTGKDSSCSLTWTVDKSS